MAVVGFISISRTISESENEANVTVELFEGILNTPVELEVVVMTRDSDLALGMPPC